MAERAARGEPLPPIDAVVGHHVNPFKSGVARFNQILAGGLGVPVVQLFAPDVGAADHPLFSFKTTELSPHELHLLESLLAGMDGSKPLSLFLHDYGGLEVEERMVRQAERVWCGNDEVLERTRPLAQRPLEAWAPGLILDNRRFQPAEVSVFSFGMAHKLRTDMFEALKRLLDASGRTYALYISSANHETASIEDAQLVFEEMETIFPRGLYFMGNLSDVAVYNHLVTTTFFTAFFRSGARANNTSIASAMEHGAVVITNLDEHSPDYLVHMDNVIDINRCEELPLAPLELRRLSVRAMETARELSWDRLVETMRSGARRQTLA